LVENGEADWETKVCALGAFEQYLRNQNMFCIWDISRDCMAPHFSNNNYHPKANIVENAVFPVLGRGNWQSCAEAVLEGLQWCKDPWEALPKIELEAAAPEIAEQLSGKSTKVFPCDPVTNSHVLACRSSSDLQTIPNESYDLVITDPPFGGL